MRSWKSLFIVFCVVNVAVFSYSPDEINSYERLRWKSMEGREAGEELLKFRNNQDAEGFAARFVLFLNQGRTTSEILGMLRIVGIPLKPCEIEALEDIYIDTPEEIFVNNILENGYSLECHVTPATRFSIVFVNEAVRQAFRKYQEDGYQGLSEQEKKIYANLEGRLCVWAPKRKIHLGGPRPTFDRVKPILLYAEPELD